MTGYAQLFLYREAALQRGCICQGTYFIIAVKGKRALQPGRKERV